MSARSAQRTRWRRWRMGWDRAGRKDRYGRLSGSQVVGSSAETSAPRPARFFVSFFLPSRNARGARDRSTTRRTRGASAAAAAAAIPDPAAASAADLAARACDGAMASGRCMY